MMPQPLSATAQTAKIAACSFVMDIPLSPDCNNDDLLEGVNDQIDPSPGQTLEARV